MTTPSYDIPPLNLTNPLGLPTEDNPAAILFANNKGGVGKSTLLREFLLALAAWKIRSRGVDMDPQANLSRRLGFGPFGKNEEIPPNLAGAIKLDEPGCAEDILVPATWEDTDANGNPVIVKDPYIDLLPSSLTLDNREAEAGLPAADTRLATIMSGMKGPAVYGFDCRPSVGHLTRQAMVAAGKFRRAGVVIVTEPGQDSFLGAKIIAEFINNYAGRLGVPHLKILGVIVNQSRMNTLVHQDGVADLIAYFGADKVWEPYLPLWSVLEASQDAAQPLSAYNEPKARTMMRHIGTLSAKILEAV